MKLFVCILFITISCGEKKAAAPLKLTAQNSQLEMSPKGITQVQKVFSLYSKTGKLSFSEIQNITQRISPKFSKYIDELQLPIKRDKKFTSTEFFHLLGESNRIILWSMTYNLQTQSGWEKVLQEEFSWADEGLLQETKRLLALFLKNSQSDKEIFLSQALKVGALFNFIDAIEPTTGSVLDSITKRMIYSSSREKLPEITYETSRLVKFAFILRYVSLNESVVKSANSLNEDRFAKWSLSCIEDIILKNYPGLTTEKLAFMLQQTTTSMHKKNKEDPQNLHNTLHSEAYNILGKNKTNEIENLSAYDLYQMTSKICKKSLPPMELNKWIRIFDSKLIYLNYTEANFCEELKDILQESPATVSN